MAKGTVNRVIILGKLGQDPEMRATNSGTQVATLNIATTESVKNTQGGYDDKTEWHRVVMFGKLAELAGKYLKKGSNVYIEGRLQTRKWQDSSGNDRWSTEVIGNEMQFIGGKSANQQSQPQQQTQQKQFQGAQQNYNNQPQTMPRQQAVNQPTEQSTGFDETIPF